MRADMSWQEIIFTTFGGLRGAVSLILAQAVVTEQAPNPTLQNQKVTAQVNPLHVAGTSPPIICHCPGDAGADCHRLRSISILPDACFGWEP